MPKHGDVDFVYGGTSKLHLFCAPLTKLPKARRVRVSVPQITTRYVLKYLVFTLFERPSRKPTMFGAYMKRGTGPTI
jgi:hypothetical protein